MSADVVHIDVFVLRGWARTWGGLAEQLTTEQHALVTELESLQLEFMSSGVNALDRAAGELSRSGTYSTRVANAAEQADGNFESVDFARFDKLAFGPYFDDEGQPRARGGALDDFTDQAASRFINRPEHDPVPGSPAPQTSPSPSPGGADPQWTLPIAEPGTEPRTVEPELVQGAGAAPDWSDALSPGAPVLMSDVGADRVAPPAADLVPGVIHCSDGSIPFGEDGVIGAVLPDWSDALSPAPPVFISGVADVPEGSISFGDDGIVAGVLPEWSDALSPAPPVFISGVADVPDVPEGSISFGADGIAGPVLTSPVAPRVVDLEPVFVQRSEPELVGLPRYPVFGGAGNVTPTDETAHCDDDRDWTARVR